MLTREGYTCKDCKYYVTDYDLLHDWCNLEDSDEEIGDIRTTCECFELKE